MKKSAVKTYQEQAKKITKALHSSAQKDYEFVRENSANPYNLHQYYAPHGICFKEDKPNRDRQL